MVIASFSLLMYLPVSIELLKIMLNGSEIIDFIKRKILISIPLGPILLLIFSSEISNSISILSQDLNTKEFSSGLER